MLFSLFRQDIETIFKGFDKLEPTASEAEKQEIYKLRAELEYGLQDNDPKPV